MKFSRRNFIGTAFCAAAGCRTGLFGGEPNLRFGVVSDIHVTTPESTALFEKSLRYFGDRGADAVMVPGDLADWGNGSSLRFVSAAWNRVFPGGKAADGRKVEKLFCTGNHDCEGWCYPDMKRDMEVNGYADDTPIVKAPGGVKHMWEETFAEPFEPIRVRTVKGYDFVSAEWGAFRTTDKWMAENGKRFRYVKPFFFFQHPPIKGTTPDGDGGADEGHAFRALKDFQNAIAITGHSHRPFCDERSIWQGSFTVIAVPSLSYAGFPPGHENGGAARDGTAVNAMQKIPSRRDLRGGQGYFVSVFDDRIEVERIDIEEDGEQGAPAWIFPICSSLKPYAYEQRAELTPAPEFPEGACLGVSTRNADTRQGKWVIVIHCEFPSALPPRGLRVFDYEIRAVPNDGSAPLVKRLLSPAYHKLARYEPETQRFWFNADDLPKDRDYVLEVYPRNCFGKCGKPLVSKIRRGK